MKKFGKKLVAMTLAGAMALAPMTAFAATGTTEETTSPAEGSANGSGALEGFLNEDDEIFKVVLPTDDTSAPIFNFKIDPQSLLNATDSSNYGTKKTLYFANKTDTSDELSITNKSQFDVDVALNAKMTGLTGDGYAIKMTDDNTFADSTDTSIYLGLVYESAAANSVDAVDSTTLPVTDATDGVTANITLGGMPTNYEIGKDGGGKYIYKEIGSPAPATGVAKFKMTGASNAAADWSAIDDLQTPAAPEVKITWTVSKHNDTPESDGTTPIVITYTGAAPTSGSISIKQPSGTPWTPAASSYTDGSFTINDTAKTLTIAPSWLAYNKTSRGTGTYVMTINGAQYSFIIK